MNDLISIIVPAYNVEKYLDRCVESIVQQTYKNLEIILVDDGSPDNCPQMCDLWVEKDKRIKVIHKQNGGLSDARNAGLALAKGEYIAFVDSDDWIEKQFIEIIFSMIKSNDCSVAGCNYRKAHEKLPDAIDKECTVKKFESQEIMPAVIDEVIKQVVWNKIYEKDLISDILFEKGKYHEDEFWTYQVFARADKYVETDYIGYNYFQRPGSIMDERYSLKRLDAVEAKIQRQVFLDKNMPEVAEKARVNLLFTCVYNGQLVLKHLNSNEKKEAIRYLENIVLKIKIDRLTKKKMKLTHKIWVSLLEISFVCVCKLRNVLRIGT